MLFWTNSKNFNFWNLLSLCTNFVVVSLKNRIPIVGLELAFLFRLNLSLLYFLIITYILIIICTQRYCNTHINITYITQLKLHYREWNILDVRLNCDVSLILAQKIAFSWGSAFSPWVVLKDEWSGTWFFSNAVSAISNKHELSGILVSVAL